jgi:hypothetical protein
VNESISQIEIAAYADGLDRVERAMLLILVPCRVYRYEELWQSMNIAPHISTNIAISLQEKGLARPRSVHSHGCYDGLGLSITLVGRAVQEILRERMADE